MESITNVIRALSSGNQFNVILNGRFGVEISVPILLDTILVVSKKIRPPFIKW